jgi:hypothetical protein
MRNPLLRSISRRLNNFLPGVRVIPINVPYSWNEHASRKLLESMQLAMASGSDFHRSSHNGSSTMLGALATMLVDDMKGKAL